MLIRNLNFIIILAAVYTLSFYLSDDMYAQTYSDSTLITAGIGESNNPDLSLIKKFSPEHNKLNLIRFEKFDAGNKIFDINKQYVLFSIHKDKPLLIPLIRIYLGN